MIEHLKKIKSWRCMFQVVYEGDQKKREPNFIDFKFSFDNLSLSIELNPIGTDTNKVLNNLLPKASNENAIAFENDTFQVEIYKSDSYLIERIKLIWREFDVAVFYE